jgi:hypothetical protein
MIWKKKVDEKISPAKARENFRDDLMKLLATARDNGVSSWDLEGVLESNARDLEYRRTMRNVV